jgi:hypothetical protein
LGVLLMMLEVNRPFFASATRRRTSIRYRDVPVPQDFLGASENLGVDDRVNDPFAPDPEMVGIADLLLSQAPRRPVMDEVTHIVLVAKNSVDHVGCPRTAVLVGDLLPIE